MKIPFVGGGPKYSEHTETLVALISFLAYSHHTVRSAPALAKVVSIDEKEITYVLEHFKSLFGRSTKLSKKYPNAPLYALHVRRALKYAAEAEAVEDEEVEAPKLETVFVNALIDFVVKKSDQEVRHALGYGTALVAMVGSLIVASLAIVYK